MPKLVRFTVSLEKELLDEFDASCPGGPLSTRSEAVRQLIREKLTVPAWAGAASVAASLTLVYDHHRPKLAAQLLGVRHRYAENVVSSLHVHLDRELCLEILFLRGTAKRVRELAAELSGLRGIHQSQLVAVVEEQSDGSDPDPSLNGRKC